MAKTLKSFFAEKIWKNVCVIFNNVDPYHISRIKSFNDFYKGEVFPIQLAPIEKHREWRVDNIPTQILTVQDNPLEEALESQVCKQLVDLNQLNPCVVVAAGYSEPAMAAAVWARKEGARNIFLSDSTYLDRPKRWLKETLKGYWIKKHFDAAFAGGAKSAEYLEGLGFPLDRIWRGYDVTDNEFFYRSSEEIMKNRSHVRAKLELSENYFLYVGCLSPEKNLIRLLDAYSLYRGKINKEPWGLVIVGSGPQEEELKNHADKIGLNDVVWPGFKQINELSSYYALASCFILPSISEPWGLVVNDAMACGLPVLVSDHCGCVPDLVYPGINGYVFNPHKTAEIAYYMERVSSGNIDRREMVMASTWIVSSYTPQTWGKALADCIEITIHNSTDTKR